MGFEHTKNKEYLKDWEENITKKIDDKENIGKISEYVLHLARIVNYPDLNINLYKNQIEDMGTELKTRIKNPRELRPTHIIEKLNEFFFDEKKFRPNTNDYYNPINNYLNIVLEKRTGIPITLSIIYIHLASYLNFELQPVNFPSHFLVKYILDKDSNESIVIDPFNNGRIMDDYILQDLLNKAYPRSNIPVLTSLLEKATTSQILTRILNNLKIGYLEVEDANKVEMINEMILSLDIHNPEATRDRGILLYRNRKFEEALKSLYEYIELNPEADDIDKILDLVKRIRKTISKNG